MPVEIKNLYYDNGFKLKIEKLTIEDKKITGIIGPNGSGKSTLLNIIINYIKEWSGKIYINGRDVKEIPHIERARLIGIVFQEIPSTMNLKAIDVIEMSRYNDDQDDELINKISTSTGIKDLLYKDFNRLSGGERRLVMLASVMYRDPDIVMLDEPNSFLDPNHESRLFKIIKDMKNSGKTIIIVLHDVNLAYMLCDNIIAMKNGSLFMSGTNEIVNLNNMERLYDTGFMEISDGRAKFLFPKF
ncbi:ABC transporter ATP-binding protein [Picrophilus oshimae]|uniref:Iron(III) dicitrate tABC ransporter, ATP-binding protein n=1 Tax=Picrophilus torridus (strain ATCC 700027 / DSM 9790 / JCM 10055 / NBRC 100828 / KAW 2/3) TaxID=1122961 RepID=Q6KZE7_PICTO|nr:ABC transporter ATP-binding protein [Picrophilus oshimae]AAT43905.1 iron(III) dicitrate tABC ransporter, ATP-binding protein [Picrophilus oshimae DSM 9789]